MDERSLENENQQTKWEKGTKKEKNQPKTHTGKATTSWTFRKACSTLTFKSMHFKLRATIPFHFVGISFLPELNIERFDDVATFHPLDKFTKRTKKRLFPSFSFYRVEILKGTKDFSLSYFVSFICQKMFSCLHNRISKKIYNFRRVFGSVWWSRSRTKLRILDCFECRIFGWAILSKKKKKMSWFFGTKWVIHNGKGTLPDT